MLILRFLKSLIFRIISVFRKKKPSDLEALTRDFKEKFNLSPEEIRKIMVTLEPDMTKAEPTSEDVVECLEPEEARLRRIRAIMKYIETPADNKYADEMKSAIEKIHLLQPYISPKDFNVDVIEKHNNTRSNGPTIQELKKLEEIGGQRELNALTN
jgi:uncharacterized tellurite resistance protein B-like protein